MSTQISKPLLALSVLGLAAGTYGVVEALVLGTAATNLGSYVPWGMGVALYLLFLGFSAGGLLLSSLIYLFGQKELKKLNGVATYATLVTEICAGIAINLDLGHWERTYGFLLTPNLGSPMFWMLVFFTLVLIVYLFKAMAIVSGAEERSRFWSLTSIPVSILFYGTNGYFFSIITSRAGWSGAMTTVWFVVAALLSGGALVAALAWFCLRETEATQRLGKVVLGLLILFGIMEWLHIASGYRGGRTELVTALNALVCGTGTYSFWGLHIGLGLVVPLLVLWGGKSSPSSVAWACLLILIGFFGFRYVYVLAAQAAPMLPGLDKAWQDPRLTLTYAPSVGEWLVTLWVSSLALLGFVMGPKVFPRLLVAKSA